ncbi:MAG: putative ABC transporter permease [Oscillospiraceae bacterium]|nr:putative ABC transporter permease [Oscillospiraceae bacterium]
MMTYLDTFERFASMSLDYLFLSFMLYSFLGWLFETTVISLWESGHFLNRGSLLGPYCPVYGGGAVLGILMAYYIPNPLLQFFASACLCICCEYLCASILEDIFHVKLWDYSGMPFNYKGHICLLGFLFFGTATTFISRFVEPVVVRLFDSAPPALITTTAILLAFLLAADTILSSIAFSRKSRKLLRFYIRYHKMMNREFRNISYFIQQKTPKRIRTDLAGMQERILRANKTLNARHIEHKEQIVDKVEDKVASAKERFKK